MYDGAYAQKCQQHLCVHVLMDEIVSKLAVLATEKGRDHGEAHRRIWGLLGCWKSYIYLAFLRSTSWLISFWL